MSRLCHGISSVMHTQLCHRLTMNFSKAVRIPHSHTGTESCSYGRSCYASLFDHTNCYSIKAP